MANHQQPAFTAYSVTKREGQDDWWTAIGAAFPHKDGEGYNVILQTIPLDGKVVLRPPKDDAKQDDNEKTKAAVRDINDRRRGRDR